MNVTPEDRRQLEAVVADRSAPQKHVWRANIILATADGCGTTEIMRRSGRSKPVVWRWQERFMREGVEGLLRDKTRLPGKAPLPAETVRRVVDLALGPPPGETTHWTGRMLAAATKVSLRSVQRILEAHQLAPHRIRAFKLSKDSKFAEKLRDIVGLYDAAELRLRQASHRLDPAEGLLDALEEPLACRITGMPSWCVRLSLIVGRSYCAPRAA